MLLVLLLIAIGIGIMGSLLGIGGGIFLVPLLILLFDVDIQIAAATSLVAVIVTSSTSASSYLHEGYVNVKLGMFLETFTTAGAVIGALLVVYLDPSTIEVVLAVALIYASVYMMFRSESKPVILSGASQSPLCRRFRCQYADESMGGGVEYDIKNVRTGVLGSFVAGNLSGLVGIGGGIVKVPIMNISMGVPIKAATATSNFMLGVTAVAGVLVYLSNGFIAPVLTGVVCIGIFTGAIVGSRTMPRLKGTFVRSLFGAILIVIAITLILRASGVWV